MCCAVRAVGAYDRVCNDECTFSFDTPFSPDGLYVSLGSYQAFGQQYVKLDHERTSNRLYVHVKHTRVAKPVPSEEEAAANPTKLGIGVAGGFALGEDKYDVIKEHGLVLFEGGAEKVRVALPCPELPELIINACTSLINHTSHLTQESNAAVAWEIDIKPSRYAADLVQLPATKKISPDPKDWVCEESGMRENLWLNLSDGHIGSGRRQYDGSGGTNGALNHYEVTRATHPPSGFPLVVKLGTITPNGADVYSYAPDEDGEVVDPKLAEHLTHWGINMLVMEKTEKSVEELNVEANQKLELDKITEAGKDLAPLSGPGYVGLQNLGNSCYMNSVLQVLFAAPELNAAFEAHGPALLRSAPADPSQDLLAQLTKLRDGLLTTRYAESGEAEEAVCVRPRMLKSLVGNGHPEFSSPRQQDAQEYLQHLLSLIQRAERAAGGRLPGGASWPQIAPLFSFSMEERIEVDGQVCYKPVKGCTQLLLPIPLESATNRAEHLAYEERAKRQKLESGDQPTAAAEEPVVPIVPFEACLAKMFAPAPLENFRGRVGAAKVTKLATFPRYLVFQLARYYTSEDWQAKKLAVQVPMPTSLDLTSMRAKGAQPGEQLLPDDEPAPAAAANTAAALEPDETIVAQLISMGFSENGCKRAAIATKNAGAEPAMEWVFAHMEDVDFNEPIPPPAAAETAGAAAGGGAAPDPEAIGMLGAMGFTEEQAKAALASTSGNIERAADWLFSHADDLDAAVAQALGQGGGGGSGGEGGGEAAESDGSGEYELLGIISHMGSNTACGHYVCHIKRDGKWALYNDRKVALSESPPLDLGYMYVYQRKDGGNMDLS